MKQGISLEEAQRLLLDLAKPVKECQVSLTNGVGRILSRDIASVINLPPFDKSPLDGYALRAGDTAKASSDEPAVLEVIEEVRAGFVPEKAVIPGTAIKVMTGAPIPQGADVVIKFEDVQRDGHKLKIFYPLKAGSNIIHAGEDVMKGERVAEKGMLLNPPLVGLLAGIGVDLVPVSGKIKIGIISTGDELVDPSQELRPGKIYNSNLHSLSAYCVELGAEPVSLGIVTDEKNRIAERITEALVNTDLVITTGGVSVGDFDMVPAALDKLGAKTVFWKVDMKPGSPLIAAKCKDKLIIGLSGNPAAAVMTFELIVVPLIKRMMGVHQELPQRISATLVDAFTKASRQRRFIRARLEKINNINYVKLTGGQSNGVLKSLVNCNVLIDVPAGSGPLVAGQKVAAVVIDSW